MRPDQMHPNLSLASLIDHAWRPPCTIVPRAHFDLALRLQFDARNLAVPFAEDARRTGWSGEGEWFDDVGEIGLGIAQLELPTRSSPAENQLCPLAIAPFPAGNLTNPAHSAEAVAAMWPERTLALGQTHCHSNLSVCHREQDRDPHFNYRFMQDVQRCRFGALTDHEYNLWHAEILLLRKLAEYYYFPGEFVALPAYEWTGSEPRDCSHDGGPFGHFNVLGFEPLSIADFHNPNDPNSPGNAPEKYWRLMRGRRVLTPPHHAVDYAHSYRWQFWDDEFQPIIELFQDDRGSAEQADAPGLTNSAKVREPVWAVDVLRHGKRFGFVAAGDHRGVALAGVWTRALTRESIRAALCERACYGTTGIHAAVFFTGNGRPMGSEGVGLPVNFEVCIASAQPPARVEVLQNGKPVHCFDGDGATRRWSWSVSLNDTAPEDFWYCRIHWADGELAWTSPLWI